MLGIVGFPLGRFLFISFGMYFHACAVISGRGNHRVYRRLHCTQERVHPLRSGNRSQLEVIEARLYLCVIGDGTSEGILGRLRRFGSRVS